MDNSRKLYDALNGQFDDLGSYEEFAQKIKEESNRLKLYNKVKEKAMFNDLGSYEEYSAKLGYEVKPVQQEPTKKEDEKPLAQPGDLGRHNVSKEGQVFREGFNQSSIVEPDAQWEQNTKNALAAQQEQDTLNAIAEEIGGDEGEWFKDEYAKRKAEERIAKANKIQDKSTRKQIIKEAEEQAKQAQIAIDNNPFYVNSLNEKAAQLDGQLANIAYLSKEVSKKYPYERPRPFTTDVDEPGIKMPSSGAEGDEKIAQLQAARNFLNQAKDITTAPLRYAKADSWLGNRWNEIMSAGKGVGDILSDPTFWSNTMSTEDNMTLVKAIKKVESATGKADELGKRAAEGDFEGILSEEEQAMLSAYVEMQSARAERANNTARMYNVGKGTVQTAEFMLEMALTAPMGAPVQQATTKAIGKFLFKQTAKITADTFVKNGLKWGATKGARLIAGQAGNLLSSGLRLPFHWTTSEAISEKALTVGEDGKLISAADAIIEGGLEAYKEIVTEGMGKMTTEAIGSALNVVGVGKILDVAAKTKPGEFVKTIYTKTTNSALAKATGWDGLGEEFLEEFDGAVWDQASGNPDALREFFESDNLLTTIGTLVPMSVIGGTTTVAKLKFAEKKRDSANNLLAEEMRRVKNQDGSNKYSEDQIRYMIDALRSTTPQQMSQLLTPIVREAIDNNLSGAVTAVKQDNALAMYNAVKNAMVANLRYTALNGKYESQESQQREDKKAELEQKYGTFYQNPTHTNEKTGQTWDTTPVVETAKLNDGRSVFILSAPSEKTGQMTAVDGKGNQIYITESDIATITDKEGNTSQVRGAQSLDGYLSYLIMQNKKRAEATRMQTEVAEQTNEIAAEYAMGAKVTLGTPEAQITGEVVGYMQEGNGVVIRTQDGQEIEKTYEELANEKGTPIQSLTDEQIENAEVESFGLEEMEYAKLQDYYKSYGKFWSDPQENEDGTTTMPFVGIVETADGKYVRLSQGQNEGEIIALSQNGEQVVLNEADVTKRSAMPLSLFLKNEEFTPSTTISEQKAEDDVVAIEEVAEETPEKPLPLKADGSVDENALWTNDPAAWAEWNDERKQDGGADSLNYVTNAVEREKATLRQLYDAYQQETDFDKRNAIDAEMNKVRERLSDLMAVQQKYQSAQQTQAQAQTQVQPSIVKANAAEMTPEQLTDLDKTYNDIYVPTRSAESRVQILQEYLNHISQGSVPVRVLTKQDYEQVMREVGCTDKQIADVGKQMSTLKEGEAIAGFQASGTAFVMAEGTPNIDAARSTYVHERQHIFNNKNPRLVLELARILGNKENAVALLEKLSDAQVAQQYAENSLASIANEIICRCMESAYKYQNFSVDLQNKGVPAQVITLIEQIDNEQRNTPNLSLSRRYDNVDVSQHGNNQQDDRNSEEVSRRVLGSQGLRSPEVGERGVGARERGAGVEESAEVDDNEDIIIRGIDFRITKTPDSNGLSYEQTDAIEKTAGELEYGDDESAATQFSIVAIAEGVGLNVVKDDGEGNVAFVAPNGTKYDANNPITAEDIKAIPDTPFGYMMADAKAIGNVSPSKEWMLWKKYALMLNAFLEKGSAKNGGIENLQGTWQFIADTVYKTVATNSDSQYSYSLDITRVCKKNEAVINAISEMQRRLGYGITPGQIMDIYLSTIEAGYQVPCPVCYVFSRYIRNGKYATIMINGQRKYGSQLVDPRTLSEKQKKERIAFWLAEKERIEKENEANKKAITKANEDITTLLKDIDALSKQITDPRSNLSEEEKAFILEKIHTLDARYRAALNVVSQSSLDSWITQFAIYQKKVDGKMQWFLYEDTFKGFPEEAALDMRMTSTAMRLYPAIQRYRNSRGSGAGKEITFVSNNDIGDVPMALGSDAATKGLASPAEISDEELAEMRKTDEYADLKLGVKNLYRQAAEEKDPKRKAELLKKARERFASASKYAKQQSLRGGQRMWSWSDNIERLAPDVFVNLMQMEMLGGALQSYSKQLEGIKLVASMNGYVNGSLMGKGNGYREVSEDEIEMVDGKAYVKDADFIIAEPGKEPIILKSPAYKHTDGKWYTLEFDDVVGIDAFGKDKDGHHFKGLFDLNAKYDKAGNILVGMNDLHIRMAMMDDRVFFIIPWHSSGANQHILAQMYDYLGVEYDVKQSQDYTDVQGEKRYKAFGEKSEEKETKDGKKKKEEVKITEHLINFWVDHYENAREVAGYGKVAGKDFDCGIEGGIENSDGNGFISASQAHYRELRDAIFNGVKVQTGVDKKGKPTYTNMNVEDAKPEWFNEIMNDEFLRQVYDKVTTALGKDGRMTSGDSKSIYPYEYWDETSTFDTADINGIRYLEYCRRLGYKPKFCGKLDGKPAKDFGNFADDKGYWKTLIDRRMYGVDKKFQDLTPVTAENFTTDLVDPVETAKEFIVTTVADERGTQTIVDSALAMEESRGGVATVDYGLSMQDALDVYNNGEVQYSIIGEVGALKDKTSEGAQRLHNLQVARDMESQLNPDWTTRDNAEALKIKVATGWERGTDGLWRYEVEDIKMKPIMNWLFSKKKLKLGDIVEDGELFRLYPDLADITIVKKKGKYDLSAAYYEKKNTIELPFGALKDDINEEWYWGKERFEKDAATMYENILHEVQHAIQAREGFARGGSEDSVHPLYRQQYNDLTKRMTNIADRYNAMTYSERASVDGLILKNDFESLQKRRKMYLLGESGYYKLAGENEAYNTGKRHPMSMEERRSSLLAATEDVDRKNQILILRDILTEGEENSVQFRIRTDEQREKLFDAAKAHYGVTNNFNAAGYMLPDGSLLDYSKANDGGDPNQRSLDHRDIEGIIMDEGTEYESRWMYIADFLNEGAIRLLPESAGINLSVAPTAEQRSRLFDFIYKYRGEVILEISDDRMNSVAYVEYNRGTAPARIFRDIDGYFNDGIVPQQDVSFRIANENQAIFVSNAAKAVESIQMGKATPEQWLKMIEKNGGLKAGEDKWMGLSDWLKASDAKTLTKEEVLAFINENMIQIEEQHYSNTEMGRESVRVLNEKYPGWEDAFSFDWDGYMEEPYADVSNNEAAVELYNKYHEDSVELDEDGEFEDMETEEKVRKFGKELADIFYGSESVVRGIHGTREGYTTRGLTNNHEIALTVPTIESWGADDAIHFGDAGDGRAVAWIRFGETEGENGERILVIDEIQSKRHQEGREQGYSRTEEYKKALARKQEADKAFTEYANYLKEKYGVNEYGGIRMDMLTEEEEQRRRELFAPLAEAQAAPILTLESGIPEAPFEKNWHELAMKRMLRYAAENGYDVVAWTKGDQQAERYALSKVVSSILYRRTEDGKKVRVNLRGADSLLFDVDMLGKVTKVYRGGEIVKEGMSLEEIVGADQAKQIQNYEGEVDERGDYYLRGEDFRIGGEGMKGFYDKMLPSFMNKYGKKWGIKVEDIDLPNLEDGLTMHSIPVTEEMKQSVMEEGQVMFKIRGANESAMDFAQQTLADFRKEYNVPAITTVVDVYDRKAVADALGYANEDFTDDDYNDILYGYEQKNGRGVYDEKTKRVAIFVDEAYRNSPQIDHNIFHENTHWIVDKHPELLELGEWLWNNSHSELASEIKGAIIDSKMYEGKEFNETLTAYAGIVMASGYADAAYQKTPTELQKHWDLIFNTFGYEPERENRRQGTRDNSGRVESSRDRRNAEEQKHNNQPSTQGLSAEERRQINEYLPGFEESFAEEQIDDYWEDEVDYKVTTGTAFSGGGLVEAGLGELIDSSFAIEYDEKIAGVYRNNHGDHILVADIRDVDIKDLAKEVDGRLDYFHASPVCKRFSSINTKAGEIELDIETATATANIIREKNPRVVTIENVPRYKGSKAMKIITDALDDLGYLWDAEVYNAADFGAATSRRRLIVRATTEGLLPVVQKSNERKSWYEVSADVIDKLPDSSLPMWMVERLAKDGIDPTNIDKPLFVFDGGAPNGKARYAWADEPLPTITASGSADRIIMPDGRVKLASPRILARATGLPDSYRLPHSRSLAHTIIGNGVPVDMTKAVIAPLLNDYGMDENEKVQMKVVIDPKVIEEFEAGEKGYAWRSAYINEESELYSPMASRLKPTATGTKQQKNESAQMGQIDQAVENPDMVDEKGHITILDEDGGKNIVAYNPYDHCCTNSMMNDQFKRAWKRDNLFVVRVSYPKREETSGYHAEKAKDPVGIKTDWKAGAVGMKLPENKRRHIMLTRLMKNLGVEEWKKVANDWIKTLKGENIDVPFNCVPRKVLNFLADAGVNIVAPESGMPEADAAYEEWKKDPIGYVGDTELPPHIKALNESVGFNPDEEGVEYKITGTPTSEVVEKGLQLSLDDFSRLAGNIYESLPENVREEVLDNAARNDWDLQNAIYQIPARLAEKESWTKEDTQLAEAIADKVTDAVRASGVEMRRPLTPNEALWMLYQSTNPTKEGDLFGAAREAVVANNLGFDEGVQFSITSTDELEDLDSIIKDGKMTLSTANQEAADAFAERISQINGNIAQLRMAAAAQREYDQNTVKAVVNVASALLEKGMLSPSTRREVVRLLNITRDAVGKKDLTITANRLIDLMISNQLRYAQELLDSYLKVRDKKVDARGIEVQGKLDINGQQIMQTLRNAVKLSPEKIDERIAIAENNLDSPSETIKRNAENELVALNLAKQLVAEVKSTKEEESDLRTEIKGDKVLYDEGRITKEEHLQFVKEAHEAIRELRMQRLNAMQSLTGNLAKMMKGSIENAERLREAEKARVEKIHHFANSDMQGMPSDEHTAIEKNNSLWNSTLVRFFLKPLATFDQMLRSFAPKSRLGEGYLWNHFMNGWMKATENEYKGVQAAHEALDAKAREVFGKEAKRWSDIFSIDRDMPSVSVKFWDGGKMKDHKLTQGNLLYIYMVNKMSDGRMKLRKMGITEDVVASIVRNLDPRFIEIADWLQGEFLPSLREKYNALHEKMFGAPMAAIDNYFPIRVLANARVREVDLGVEESNSKPSTITGSIIKRTKNALALDVMGSNAFDVILEHIQDMEHWHAFAEWNRDLNTLLSYKKFRNRVQNMTGIYGAGTTAWNNFRTTAEIAAGVYKPAAKPDSIDKLAVNLAKSVTGAKISFRVYTAIKQLLSMPAFVSDANIATLAKNMATPWVAWNWAMENLPMFEKRWKSRQAGDSRLMQTESDYKIWKTKFVETASRLGMTPNALVDAVTVAIGARSIYETKVKQYIKDGYSQEKAEEKAKRDATILFNESQQSNESAFLSAIQIDRTVSSVMFSVFRNSSMGYQRMLVDAVRNFANSMRKGYREDSIEYMKKQMVRDGLTEEQAARAAERIFNRSFIKNAARVATFGFLVQFAWNLGAVAPYILYQLCKLVFGGGDDEEELVEPIKDAAVRALVGAPIEGLTGGSVLSNFIGNIVRGEKVSNVNTTLLPVVSDFERLLKMLDNDWVAASNEMLNIFGQMVSGVNPQTFTDVIVAVVDACNGDLETSKEALLCMMRVLQVPQSQIEKVYIDEIGFTADKGLDMRIEEFAKRYADYKVMRGAPMTGWLYSDEDEKKAEDKYINRFLKTAEELKRTKGNETAKEYFEFIDGTYKEIDLTLKDLRKMAREAEAEGDIDKQINAYNKEAEFYENLDPDTYGLYEQAKEIERDRKKVKNASPEEKEILEDEYLEMRNDLVEQLKKQD